MQRESGSDFSDLLAPTDCDNTAQTDTARSYLVNNILDCTS